MNMKKDDMLRRLERINQSIGSEYIEEHGIKIQVDDDTLLGKYVKADDIRRRKKNPLELIRVCEIPHLLWAIKNGLDNNGQRQD